jgi:osmotically-inducible protein OsmY
VLEADPEVNADQIRPNCTDKVIVLEGSVPSEREKRRAEMDAWSMFAVRGVVNRLQVSR